MTLTKIEKSLLAAVRTALSGQTLDRELFGSLSGAEWTDLHSLSARQGVQAVVYDALTATTDTSSDGSGYSLCIPQQTALRWMLGVDSIEHRFTHQLAVGKSVAEILTRNDIPAVVLKGLAVGTFYPRPEHRECGDIDIYTGKTHDIADELLAADGAEVEEDYYVHSHIFFQGVIIENHRFFNPIRGNSERKALERHFIELINGSSTYYIQGTGLIIPPPDFNALFLAMHSLKHFIYEGVKLRHVTDWAMFLNAEQGNVDWAEFFRWADKMHFTRFANALTLISEQYFGLNLFSEALISGSHDIITRRNAELILEDILRTDGLTNNKGRSVWRTRLKLLHNTFDSLWKYHRIYRKSAVVELSKTGLGIIFDRNPEPLNWD